MCCFKPYRSSARDATAHFLHDVHFGRHTAQPGAGGALLPCGTWRRDTPHGTLHVCGVVTSALDLVEEGLYTVSNAQRGALSVARALLVPFGLSAVRQPHTDGDCRTVP